MKTICLYFQVHQPFRFKRYRFFNIGNDHYYFDDYLNESIMHKVAHKCYLPTNKILLKLIKQYRGKFRLSFSITGIALDQFRLYSPEVIESFKELADTGCVEFLAETYSHSLAAFKDDEEFKTQVESHAEKIEELFGQRPKVFRNTEMIYSDQIGQKVYDLGYKGMLTEGAKHILGWKSPNYLYCNAINPKLKVLLKNFELSDDIAFRFSNKAWTEYPLTAGKFANWLLDSASKGEMVNLFMDYETFGEHQSEETGIFDFLKELPKEIFKLKKLSFSTPSEIIESHQPISAVKVPNPISWADEERDLTAWLGNDLQEDAFNRLYALQDKIKRCSDTKILTDWKYMQASDHFYYMCTKVFSDGDVHSYFNPYDSPYDAYINYMNILSDFIIRLNASVPDSRSDKELATLAAIIYEKNQVIEKYERELIRMKSSKSPASSRTQKKEKPPKKKLSTKQSQESDSKAKSTLTV